MSGSALSLSCYVIHRIVITSSMLIRFYWLDQVQNVAGWLKWSDLCVLQIRWSDRRLDVVRCDMAKVGESEWVSVTLSELPAHPACPAAHPPPPSSHFLSRTSFQHFADTHGHLTWCCSDMSILEIIHGLGFELYHTDPGSIHYFIFIIMVCWWVLLVLPVHYYWTPRGLSLLLGS